MPRLCSAERSGTVPAKWEMDGWSPSALVLMWLTFRHVFGLWPGYAVIKSMYVNDMASIPHNSILMYRSEPILEVGRTSHRAGRSGICQVSFTQGAWQVKACQWRSSPARHRFWDLFWDWLWTVLGPDLDHGEDRTNAFALSS
jgi:hypothetical protein